MIIQTYDGLATKFKTCINNQIYYIPGIPNLTASKGAAVIRENNILEWQLI